MNLPRLLALWGVLSLFALATPPARAADAHPSAQDARVDLIWQDRVDADPSAQLYVAEALAAMGHQPQADLIRRALIALWLRRINGEAADPGLTLGSLLQQSGGAAHLVDGESTATAWQAAVTQHVQLQFLDEVAADQPVPADARAGTHQIAPGLWVPAERVGSMLLFVRAHQDLAAPVPLSRLKLLWQGERLTCTPVHGTGTRQQDAQLVCEGPSHVDKLPALARAVTSAVGRAVDGVVQAGEFDTPGTVSAWVDALAAGHDVELKRLLARAAPCETERDMARRCEWSGPNAPPVTAHDHRPGADARETPRANPGEPTLLGEWMPRLGGWFFGGAIAMWFICGWLRSSSMLMEVVVHVVVTLGLLFVTKWAVVIGWAAWIHQNQSEVLAGTAAAFAIYVALAAGMVAGAGVHFLRRVYQWWEDNRGTL
jgi:hypothetical protein